MCVVQRYFKRMAYFSIFNPDLNGSITCGIYFIWEIKPGAHTGNCIATAALIQSTHPKQLNNINSKYS